MQQVLSQTKVSERQILAELCRRSFYRFVKEFISEIEPAADNFVWNWHIKYLCDQLQEIVINYRDDKPTEHLNLNICPGATKSTIVSRMFTPWIWTVFPDATTINVTRDTNNIKDFALKSKELIESDKYKKLFPEIEIKKEPNSMFYYENTKGGRRYGLTTLSKGSTGKHGDFVIFDDAYAYIDLDSTETVRSLETSLEAYLSRFKDKSKGIVINVMQRLGVNDPTAFFFTGYLEQKPKLENYRNICLPAEDSDLVEPKEIRSKYTNGLLDEIRLNHEILRKERLKYGFKYDAQFAQDPLLDKDGLMYPVINTYNYETPEGVNFTFSDIADTGDDYLCTWFCRISNNKIYVYDAIYTKEGSGVTIPTLKLRLANNNSAVNWMEANNQGSVFISQLQNHVPNLNGVYESGTSKKERIFSFSYYAQFLHFKDTGTPEYMLAVQHLKRIPKKLPNSLGNMDVDSADALTAMLRYFYTNFQHLFIIK